MTIGDAIKSYKDKLDHLDKELILAHSLEKTREFVLTHPEYKLTKNQELKTKNLLARRIKGEPVAYIMGHKEFYRLDFIVNKNTLVPRPETELLVEEILRLRPKNQTIIDIGTGSGNIIAALAKNINTKNVYIGTDISPKALLVAKQNAKKNKVDKKIIFIQGNLLTPLLKANKLIKRSKKLIFVANLPYLSGKIYSSTLDDVKKYEPKSALFSAKAGLAHYEKLLRQIDMISKNHKLKTINCILEFSPEQKKLLEKTIGNILPDAKASFRKDLAGKWRVCKITI